MAKFTLLLIDDDDLSREILVLLLEQDDFVVAPFASGDLALAYLAEEQTTMRWTAVLTDMQMPGTSGNALAGLLRARVPRGTRILAMSGSQVRTSELEGFDGFLLKPFNAADLRALLAETPKQAEGGAAAVQTRGKEPAQAIDDAVTAPVLEEKTFDEFAALLGPAQMQEFVTLCVAEVARYTRSMQNALEKEDQGALRTAAHTLKGSVAMLGARELQAMAGRLEQGTADTAYQQATLTEIGQAAERLRGMLRGRGFQLAGDAGASEDKDTIA